MMSVGKNVLRISICYIMLYICGCGGLSSTEQIALNYALSQPPPQTPQKPSSEDFDKTFYFVFESEPSDVSVFVCNNDWKQEKLIGSTPLEIPLKFCEKDGVIWFKNPNFLNNTIWSPMQKYFVGYQSRIDLHRRYLQMMSEHPGWVTTTASLGRAPYTPATWEKPSSKADMSVEEILKPVPSFKEYITASRFSPLHSERLTFNVKFLLCADNYYSSWVDSGFHVDNKRDGINIQTFINNVELKDGAKVYMLGWPTLLVESGGIFFEKLTDRINSGDYYAAEKLRLTRLSVLESRVTKENLLVLSSKVDKQLMTSEIDQLKHLVGLLDQQLMALRKQLLTQLQEGNIEAALTLAQAVGAMEKRYFPEPPPQQIIVQTPIQPSMSAAEPYIAQNQGKQEIVIQQKPYYGAQNIVQALGAMRGSKLEPEAYQQALGAAQLLDIMGLGKALNK